VSRVGRTLPAHATALGKALLAELTDTEIRGLLPARLAPLTEHTVTDRAALLAELAVIRDRGYALEHEEGTPGVACAAAVVPYRIPATDAISCSMPAGRTDTDTIGARLAEVATELGATLRRAGIR
jgi:DNA-binding IclR family transcriptional regulator